MWTFRIWLFMLILFLISPLVYGQSVDQNEKGKLEIWFRITTTPMTERDIYYHICKLYINGKEMGESPSVNKEDQWFRIFSLELDEGIYEVKVRHGYSSKEGKWASEFPKQPEVFRAGIQSDLDVVIKYSYNIGLIRENYVYDKIPDIPAKILPRVASGYKPRILVVIPEQHLRRQRIPDPAAETEVIRKFVENDFYVVDQAQIMDIRYNDQSKRALQGDTNAAVAIGRQFDAEVLIIGEAFSQSVGSSPGLVECNARVEARAIRIDTGQILAAYGLTAISSGNSEELASKQALAQAGGILGDYMIQEIIRKWTSRTIPSVRVKLVNIDFKQLVLFEQALKEKVKVAKDFHRRNFDMVGKIAEIDVDIDGTSQEFSTELTSQDFLDFDVEVLNFTANVLDLRLKPKETTPSGLALCPKALIFMDYVKPDGNLKKYKFMVLKADETSMEYNWALEFSDGSSKSGVYKSDAFNKSHTYDIDWEPPTETESLGTAPWVSREVFSELRDNGFTTVIIDKITRKDSIVIAELKGMTTFPVVVNGKKQNLKAVQVYTDKGDKLLILDEIQNPLVLSAEIPGIYNSKVTTIYVPGYK
jgi:hypothetical protein